MAHKDITYLDASNADELLRAHEPNESQEETTPNHPTPTWLVSDAQKARA